ncbi:MAG: alpha/beta hydrolase [Mycobacterium sp.]
MTPPKADVRSTDPPSTDAAAAGPKLKRGEESIEINGGNVVYETLGESGTFIALTPGGRFSKDIEGLRPLAEELVKGGYRVLLWDRPNCGKSDVQFYGQSESHMRAETLHALITGLGIGPCILAGGSGGARDSMLTTMLYPEIVRKLVVWNIVGGVYGTFVLGSFYIVPSILAVRGTGMAGVTRVSEWKERIAENPANLHRLTTFEADEFLTIMLRWLNAFVSKPGQTIPGVPDEMFGNINVPTLIIRGGENDLDHPKRTSLEVSCLIKGSQLVDPPWPEDAWERASEARASGKVKHFNMFDTWVQAAPAILKFLDG